MKIYNVFPLNLLQNAYTDPFIDQVNEPILPVIINNKKECKVKDIFDARSQQDKIQYQVKWIG